ncbi:hypothetical protein VKT23_016537 [Stygiomarasmius scandens]|uniref:Uncharacterized protein n=1 Tax=Marasmiellus scandens TaxID=2682957 RepID=A0ABR1IX13_9AGAR
MFSFKSAFPDLCCSRSDTCWLSKVFMSRRLHRKSSAQASTPVTPSPTDFSYQCSILTTPTSLTSDEQRWSEVVPPKAALTFAPVWDSDHDTVRFSSAQLLNMPDSEEISPSDACSQVLTIGRSTLPLSEPTSTLQFFQDNYDYLFSHSGSQTDRKKVTRTQTSSTLDGLDVYLRGSLMGTAHKSERYFSCLDYLDKDFDFDPRTSFAKNYADESKVNDDVSSEDTVSDEGFFEVSDLTRDQYHERATNRERELVSRISQPPLSMASNATSEFVSIGDDDTSSQWSTLDRPESPAYVQLLIANQQRNSVRRLKKRRPSDLPAPPAEVLQREVFSHQVSVPIPSHPSGGSHCQTINNIVHCLSRKKSYPAVGQWMCVEVTQEVRQQYR